jgi:endonuclease/exonuclease/phosphatase family metal-dependent hydrolase
MRTLLVVAALVALSAVLAACNHPRPRDLSIEAASHARADAPVDTGARLRVVQYNVHMIDARKIVRALRQTPELAAADVIFLNEVESHPKEKESRACLAAKRLDMYCAFAPGYGLDDGGAHGVAILSRRPLADLAVTELPYHDTVFNSARRVALGATITAGDVPVRVYAVHLDNRINPAARKRQLAPVLDDADARGLATVIAGDMNTSPFVWIGHVVPVPAGVQDDRLEKFVRGRGYDTPLTDVGPTSAWLGMRLDAVYTRGVDVRAHGVADTVRASDHLPVWADLEVVTPAAVAVR